MNQLTYRQEGDYLVPNLTLPPETPRILGKYGRQRLQFLKEHRPILYTNMKMSLTLNEHLAHIDETATAQVEQTVKRMAVAEGVTEELKAADQIAWVQRMNNIRHRAEEMVESLIYG
ncbi:MAG: TnpV protein [Oscillospiraceae bacterium]|nr:TnpV protein [Oscillospiraceae bacterium]